MPSSRSCSPGDEALLHAPGGTPGGGDGHLWREHRLGSRDLFARELAEARALIAGAPAAGSTYSTRSGKLYRRVFMPKTKNHVYFEVDEARDLVVVHAIWGAPKGRGPKL
jgi:hypothetical protein